MSKTDVQNNFQFPRPTSPSKPNAHPYAIVTSSSSLLSRSSSSTSTNTRSHYVPPSPKSPSQARPGSHSRPGYQRHHYSNSNSKDAPRPLPVPPSASPSPTKEHGSPDFSRHATGRRADSFPNAFPPPNVVSLQPSVEDLPENPKLWTPSQLSVYLSSALRVKSGETLVLPAPVVNDISLFVRDKRINGRSFLRITEHELEQYGVNKLWQEKLLDASRRLRHNILKGRIWGFGSGDLSANGSTGSLTTPFEEDDTPSSRSRIRARSDASKNGPFVKGHSRHNSSTSSLESFDESPTRGRNGRVRNMAHSFESSGGSFHEDDIVPPSRSGMLRRGSVSSSDGSFQGSSEDLFASAYDGFPPAAPDPSSTSISPSKAAQRPLPATPSFSPLFVSPPTMEAPLPAVDGELTMEELLAQETGGKQNDPQAAEAVTMIRRKSKKGAQAWEADDSAGLVTVKKVPTSSSSDSSSFGRKVGDMFNAPAKEEVIQEAVDMEELQLAVEEKRLLSETESSREILRRLEARLTDLEGKITEMEKREAAITTDKTSSTGVSPRTQSPLPDNASIFGKLVYSIFGYPSSPEPSNQLVRANDIAKGRKRPVYEVWDPKTISELPPYILLVSIGVVAVMIKVALKRGPAVRG